MSLAGLFDDGPLYRWLRNGRPDQLYASDLRQSALDVLELGTRAAAWLHKDDGGIYQLTGYHARAGLGPDLAALVNRVQTKAPHLRQGDERHWRPRLAVVK